MQSAGMVFGRTIATIGIFLTFYSKRASHRRYQRFSGLKSSSKLFDESLETISPAIGISINPLYSSEMNEINETTQVFIVLNQKKKKKGTKHARTQTHSVMIISTLVTTFLLRCIYLRFLDSMSRYELWGRVRKTWQTATELDRP